MSQLKIKQGNTWVGIPAGGVGVPAGGNEGDVLTKSSSTDYATEWQAPSSFAWKYHTNVTGTTKIDLPSTWNELWITITLTSNYHVQGVIVRDALPANGTSEDWYLFGASYWTDKLKPVFATTYISKTTYRLYSAMYSDSTVTNSAITNIYYR